MIRSRTALFTAVSICLTATSVTPPLFGGDQQQGPDGVSSQWPTFEEGVVTAVGKDSITIQEAEKPPRQFAVSEELAAGKVGTGAAPITLHRLPDVKVGDRVVVGWKWVNRQQVCCEVGIHRRPGGRVPPAADDWTRYSPDARPRFHEVMNAYQDSEEKGLPLPPWITNQTTEKPLMRPLIPPMIPPAKP